MKLKTFRNPVSTLLVTLLALVSWSAPVTAGPRIIEVGTVPDRVNGPYVISDALRQARELRRTNDESVRDGVRIVLADGVYPLVEPLLLRPEDSGSPSSPTVIEAAGGARPVISGGIPVTGWTLVRKPGTGLPVNGAGKVWVADAPRLAGRQLEFRQMWVNGSKANRARDHYDNDMRRILEWDKEARVCWIPADDVQDIKDPQALEMVMHQMWEIAFLRVKSLEVVGDRARLSFMEPESRIEFEHPWPPVVIQENGNSAYYLTNHAAFLDQPGEWYQDLSAGKVYYWPRGGEDMTRAGVVVPVLETLVQVDGTPDRPVRHVEFKGIQFSHTAWLRPSRSGHVPLQAGMYLLDAYKLSPRGTVDSPTLQNLAWIGRQPAAVEVRGASDIAFNGCHFRHLGGSGLDFVEGSHRVSVTGCLFRDIACNGIVIGAFPDGGMETHLAYDPSDERILCHDATIANNLVTNVANEDWGCVGILAGFVWNVSIAHNEVCDVSYTGISLGWGWTPIVNAMRNNEIVANHIHHFARHNYDTGGIYTLSAQPRSSIRENFIHSIYRPEFVHNPNHWSYIYLDEGSSFFTVKDNWTEGLKYSTNANGPGNTWENNGPSVSAKILQRAGLEEAYIGLEAYATVKPDDPVEL